MPYGILTKMFKIHGWKRMELNHLMTFKGVSEQDFESILRRCLIIKIKARFFDDTYLNKHLKDHETMAFLHASQR